MNKKKMEERVYVFFFTGIASLAMLCSVCDAFQVTYKARIFYSVFVLYLMILCVFLYREKKRCLAIIGMTLFGEVVLSLSGNVEESLQSIRRIVSAQIKSYFLEGRYATVAKGVDETWGLLFLMLLFTSISAFAIVCCKKRWCISGLMGISFALPFLTGMTPKRHTFFLVLLVFFGVILGKSGEIKDRDCLRAAIFGVCAGSLAFLIGVPLFSNNLENLLEDETVMQRRIDEFWNGDIRKSIQRFEKSDRATGGVNDGNLGSYSGLDPDQSVHLKVKMKKKPQDAVYLRGFVGDDYTGNSWKRSEERRFQFKQEGLEVENIKANRKYRYHTYPNEKEIPKEWEEGSAYEKMVYRKYRGVPENIREAFAEVAEREIVRTKPENVVVEVANLLEHTTRYSLNPGKLPKGKDFAEYFFFERKSGYCTHFATTAVLLFRMEDIPARYVVGYVARPEEFVKQEDGTYLAEVTGEEAHAWAEIYVSGTGWIPAETTPGYTGEVTESDVAMPDPGEVEEEVPDTEPESIEETEEHKEKIEDGEEPEYQSQQGERGVIEKPKKRFNKPIVVSVSIFILVAVGAVILCGKNHRQKRKKRIDYSERTKEAFYRIYKKMLSEKSLSENVELEDEFVEKVCKRCPKIQKSEAEQILDIIYRANYGKEKIKKEEYSLIRRVLLLLEKKK